jgi:ABC-type oligopeptide transport system ATPase subunit
LEKPAAEPSVPASGSDILKVENLSKHFAKGGVKAVDDVSFAIRSGEITTVVGESGSGKSTLARLVLRLMPPTSFFASISRISSVTIRWLDTSSAEVGSSAMSSFGFSSVESTVTTRCFMPPESWCG